MRAFFVQHGGQQAEVTAEQIWRTSNQEGTTAGAGTVRCRVAVCLSGAVRSFVHPAVHRSIKSNLIESIEAGGCEVDVFAYATREDTVPRHKQ
ncbi:unnamed protein product, partial [Ectocarpus fasciculatus]